MVGGRWTGEFVSEVTHTFTDYEAGHSPGLSGGGPDGMPRTPPVGPADGAGEGPACGRGTKAGACARKDLVLTCELLPDWSDNVSSREGISKGRRRKEERG